jgi:hypothetical protein
MSPESFSATSLVMLVGDNRCRKISSENKHMRWQRAASVPYHAFSRSFDNPMVAFYGDHL